jgi:hypothetical protein
MRAFSKLSFDEWHINPILRDMILLAISGLAVAIAFISIIAMLASRY